MKICLSVLALSAGLLAAACGGTAAPVSAPPASPAPASATTGSPKPAAASSSASASGSQATSAAPAASSPATSSSAPGNAAAAGSPAAPASGKVYIVGISQLVTHPSIEATIKGIKEGMTQSGFIEGTNVKYLVENAQGQVNNARAIAEKFDSEKPDLIVPLTTPNSQAMVKVVKDRPVVFGMVTDPVQAGLVPSYDKPSGTNVTGVYNFNPVEQQFDDFHLMVPAAKTVGLLFNTSEDNSVVLINKGKAEAPKVGLKTIDATVASSNDVLNAAQSLVGRADAIYVPQDNTVVSAFDAVMKVANANKLPVFAGAPEQVQAGAILTVAYSQEDMGIQIGKLMAQVLRGANPGSLAPQQPDKTELDLNKKAAGQLGLTIPDTLLKQAAQVY